MRSRLVLLALLAILAILAILVADGCGGGSSSSSGDPASVVPEKAPFFMDFTLRPEGEMKRNIEVLAEEIAAVDDLGSKIFSELEKSAADHGEGFDFESEVEPWLGEEGGLFLQEYDGEDFEGYGVAIQAEDEGEARAFVDKQVEASDEDFKEGSYEGVEFKVQEDETTIGVFDGFVVFAEDEAIFKAMVDASEGESLASQDTFTSATANVPDESAADVFVDIGRLIEEAGDGIDPETQLFLDAVGIEPREATAVASLVPGSGFAEVDVNTNLGGDQPSSGDASELLGSLPGTSVAAFASADFGKRFNEGIDKLDRHGIPGEVPPHQLKSALKKAGIDLESIADSIGDAGVFLEGSSESDLGAALVLVAENAHQAKNTVSNVGLFLRASGAPGITAVSGKASGFSIHSAELGPRPIVVVAKGDRIAIGYGLKAALKALQGSGFTLSDIPAYRESIKRLGSTPITAFVDGAAAVRLALALGAHRDEDFRNALRYVKKVDRLALGSEVSEGLSTIKLILFTSPG